ncbi:MAG: SusC/RagA family TonB-linked outer membrane protein, partial [Capnocytophaga sp.]|nr:SusC/RagA family TonB-linked outer membrane protein [Capnocytophaga sp.]
PLNNRAYGNIAGADFLDAQYSKSYLIYHGSIEPNTNAGLSNTFQYKNWEFSFFITAQAGNKIRLNPSFDPAFADLNVFSTEYYNRWLQPGDEWHTEVPVLPSQDLIRLIGQENIERAYNTYNYSQNRVADGSFIRMKNISLAYTLSQQIAKKFGMKTINLRGQLTNPFLIYSDSRLKGQDPEYYRSGGVSLPTPKQFTLTVNAGF